MSRTLVLGDVHGAFRALEQVFERAGVDPSRDRLISLGDLCDRWPEVDKCFDLILEVEDRTVVLGNHDEWTADWAIRREVNPWWFEYGGAETYASYARRAGADTPRGRDDILALADAVPDSHKALLRAMVPYHIEDGRLFTHAGWDPGTPPERQTARDLRLSRELWTRALLIEMGLEREGEGDEGGAAPSSLTGFAEVYLGHTPTDWIEPRPVLEIWNLDQGAGWDGVLTLMDVETKEYWQSDPVRELYG
ncbi:MAG: metallophosphoesterase [Candidatus Longimicrobiales bacterium M2_2A_002]